MSAECWQKVPGRWWTPGDANGCGWVCDLRRRTFHDRPALSMTTRWRRILRRLTTQRSQDQVLPPLPVLSAGPGPDCQK